MKQTISLGDTFTWQPKGLDRNNEAVEEFVSMVVEDIYEVEENSFITGNVIYVDSECFVVEISDMSPELFQFTLFANEAANAFPTANIQSKDPNKKYLCLDIQNLTSLFFYDLKIGKLNNYYTKEVSSKSVSLELDRPTINDLENDDLLVTSEDVILNSEKEDIPVRPVMGFCICRAVSWINTEDCAILTAWRGKHMRRINDTNNRILQQQLRNYGYGVSNVTGWYAENNQEASRENSFFVTNRRKDPFFKERIFELSEHYNQDAFLYKKAGPDTPAILVFTNDDCEPKGTEILLGRLHIGNMNAEAYTQIGSGRITFEND